MIKSVRAGLPEKEKANAAKLNDSLGMIMIQALITQPERRISKSAK